MGLWHFGVDRHDSLNGSSAGELTACSELECALCSGRLRNKGCGQRHVSTSPWWLRFLALAVRSNVVRALTVITLSFSAVLASTASFASASGASGKTSTPGTSGTSGTSATAATKPNPVTAPKPSTAQRISRLEAATRANPQAGEQWRELGTAYVRQAFEAADPAFYPLAESSLLRAEKVLGTTPAILVSKANLALARHRFTDARNLAQTVVRTQPEALAARIALFDAEVELGNYEVAFRAIDELVAQRPNVATLSRLSYRRQLNGDLMGAEIAMRQAVSAAPPESIDRAVALGYLGDVLLEAGRLAAASRSYDQSARLDPANGTAALGQARVLVARGNPQGAIALLDRLTDRNPLPGALGLRAEIARSLHDTKLAKASDELVDASMALFQSNGAVVDAELAILLADRGAGFAAAALDAAKRAYADRRTVFTNDAMAWSLFVAGRPTEAQPFAHAAVALSPGISSVRWHAAEVFAATGDRDSAQVELVAALGNPWSNPAQAAALRSLVMRVGLPTRARASAHTNTNASTISPKIAAVVALTVGRTTQAAQHHVPTTRLAEVHND
jgi:predicted Zn-dependent protease